MLTRSEEMWKLKQGLKRSAIGSMNEKNSLNNGQKK